MARRACDGDGLLEAFRAAVANLEAHVDEINAPQRLSRCPTATRARTCSRPSRRPSTRPRRRPASPPTGSPRPSASGRSWAPAATRASSPARSSGAWPRGSAGKTPVQRPRPGPRAVAKAHETAYGAVAKPVEGTILTVIRESAAAAVAAAERDDDIEAVLAATVDAAEKSVARTPSLLAILREAGVVDSGGQGLYRLFQGALLHLVGKASGDASRRRRAAPAPRPRRSSPTPTRGSATRRCSCSRPTAQARSTSTPSATTSRRSASPCWSPATRGRSRSTSTTSGPTW